MAFRHVFSVLLVGFLVTAVESTHFRFATFSYTVPDPVNDPNTVQFTSLAAWRTTFLGTYTFLFGDSSSFPVFPEDSVVVGQYTDVNGEEVTFLRRTFTHTYATGGSYTIGWQRSGDRISSLLNAPDGAYGPLGQLVLGTGGDNSSPQISIPSLIPMSQGLLNTFDLNSFITDVDQDAYICVLGSRFTPLDAIPSVPNAGGSLLRVTSDCKLEWDLTSYAIQNTNSDKFAVLFEIENEKGVILPVDVVIEVTASTTVHLTCPPLTQTQFAGKEGDTLSATFELDGPGTVGDISATVIGDQSATLTTATTDTSAAVVDIPYDFSYQIPAGTPDGPLQFTLVWNNGFQSCAQGVTINVCDDIDGDTVCDDFDICRGGDDLKDTDGDGIPDFCDTCPQDPANTLGCDVDTRDGSMMGDPHVARWNKKSFEFHGECDLVMLHSGTINGNKTLNLHVRTTIDGAFSSITAMALAVGNSLIEVDPYSVYHNGKMVKWEELPLSTDDFYVTRAFHINRPKRRVGEPKPIRRYFDIVLNNNSTIHMSRTMLENSLDMLSISIEGSAVDFKGSRGLLGDYYTGDAIGRDGRDMGEHNWNAYGLEWQVQEDEPKLFLDADRAPQLPHAPCKLPPIAITSEKVHAIKKEYPRLYFQAQLACAKVGPSLDDCMEDVMLAKDVKVAESFAMF